MTVTPQVPDQRPRARRKRWCRRLLIAALIVLLPSIGSRVLSPWRAVDRHGPAIGGTARQPGSPLRIVTYNIAHGRGQAAGNWTGESAEVRRARLDGIAALLATLDADIVVLNEVDFESSWSHGIDQAAYLAKRAGYPYRCTQRNVDLRVLLTTWRFGNAVLSRVPIIDAERIHLPGYAWYESLLAGRKQALACTLDLGDRRVIVAAVHLSHRSARLRLRSAETLVDFARSARAPLIIAGDLNATPPPFPGAATLAGRNAVTLLDDAGFTRRPVAPPAARDMTFSTRDPQQVIDWILAPPGWTLDDYATIDAAWSDHRPVCATVRPPDR